MAFLNPFFLLGALAATIPILVHLVRRTRAQKVVYPSLMFLRKIEQKTVRRRKLRNLLLLLLRCLALLLLALAFSRPYFTSQHTAASTSRSSSVILVDSSASMRYADHFERARRAAHNVINNAATDEQIALVSFSQSYDILQPLKNNHAEANTLIDGMKPTLGASDYLQAVQAADAILKEIRRGDRKVYLITDFQTSGWNRAAAQVKLDPAVKLIPVDVSDAKVSNLAITDVRADAVVYTQKYANKLIATVNNFGDEIVDTTVDFKLNDLVVERREVSLDGGSSKTVEFTGFNVPEGSNRASVEVSGDNFTFDNRNAFVIRRENQIRILAIETASRGRSESLFLQQALLAGENNRYELTLKTAGSASPGELADYRAIIINDVGTLSEAFGAALKTYVERGGGLIIACGKHTEPGDFNRLFADLSPAQLSDTAQSRGSYALMSQIKTDHPVFAPFAKGGRLASTRVYSYHKSSPKETAEVLASLDDGSPVLIEGLAGRGKVLMLTTTLDTAWNDLPLTPMFLPLVRQMLDHLSGSESPLSYTVGQIFTAPPDADGNLPAIENPTGGRINETRRTSTGELAVNADEIGFYRLRYRDHTDNIAVDLDGKESDFTKLNIDEFVSAIAQKPDEASAPLQDRLSNEELEARQRLWLPLIVLALLLFVTEAIVARRLRIAKLVR